MKHILPLYLIATLLFSCKYGNEIQKETQERILSHKQFIKDFSFNGTVTSLKYCNNCKFNKYQIYIDVIGLNIEDISLSKQSFPPFYEITSENQLCLSVNKSLYDAVKKGVEVVKKVNSNNLIVDREKYELLSQVKYEWIPNIDSNDP